MVEKAAETLEEMPSEVDVQTFAQALQGAVSEFTAQVGALNTAHGGVSAAADSVVAAEVQIASARSEERGAIATHAEASKAALTARDEVVEILQSWTP